MHSKNSFEAVRVCGPERFNYQSSRTRLNFINLKKVKAGNYYKQYKDIKAGIHAKKHFSPLPMVRNKRKILQIKHNLKWQKPKDQTPEFGRVVS